MTGNLQTIIDIKMRF